MVSDPCCVREGFIKQHVLRVSSSLKSIVNFRVLTQEHIKRNKPHDWRWSRQLVAPFSSHGCCGRIQNFLIHEFNFLTSLPTSISQKIKSLFLFLSWVHQYTCVQLCVMEMFDSFCHVCRVVLGHSHLFFWDVKTAVDELQRRPFNPSAWLDLHHSQRKREMDKVRDIWIFQITGSAS